MRNLVVFLFLALLFVSVGCVKIKADVTHFDDPTYDKSRAKRFDIVPIRKDGSLEEKAYLGYAKTILEEKGFIYDPKTPDFLVIIQYGVAEKSEYVPPTTYYTPKYNPGTTTYHSGMVGGTMYSGTSTSSGTWTQEAHTTGGYTKTNNVRDISIQFVDMKTLIESEGKQINLIWEGRVHSEGKSTLSQVAKCLIGALLEDYPQKPEKSSKIISGDEFKKCYQE